MRSKVRDRVPQKLYKNKTKKIFRKYLLASFLEEILSFLEISAGIRIIGNSIFLVFKMKIIEISSNFT